jgi:hypothetical protein
MRKWQEYKATDLTGGITDFPEISKPNQLKNTTDNVFPDKDGLLRIRDGADSLYRNIVDTVDVEGIPNTVKKYFELEGFIFAITTDNRCFYIEATDYPVGFFQWTELLGPEFTQYGSTIVPWTPEYLTSGKREVWIDCSDNANMTFGGFPGSLVTAFTTNLGTDPISIDTVNDPLYFNGAINGVSTLTTDVNEGRVIRNSESISDVAWQIVFVSEIQVADDKLIEINGPSNNTIQIFGDHIYAESEFDQAFEYYSGGSVGGPNDVVLMRVELTGSAIINIYLNGSTTPKYTLDSFAFQFYGQGFNSFELGGQANTTLGEVVLDDTAASSYGNIEGYLAWKWGIEDQLPVGHGFKNAAPTHQLNQQPFNMRLPFSDPSFEVDWNVKTSNGHAYITGYTYQPQASDIYFARSGNHLFYEDNYNLVLTTQDEDGASGAIDKPTHALNKKIYISKDVGGTPTPQLRSAVLPRIEIDTAPLNNSSIYQDFELVDEQTFNGLLAEFKAGISSIDPRKILYRVEIGVHERYNAVVGGTNKTFANISDPHIYWIKIQDNWNVPLQWYDKFEVASQVLSTAAISNIHGYTNATGTSFTHTHGYTDMMPDFGHWNTGIVGQDGLAVPYDPYNEEGLRFFISTDFATHNVSADDAQQYVHPNAYTYSLSTVTANKDGKSLYSWYPTPWTPYGYTVPEDSGSLYDLTRTSKEGDAAGRSGEVYNYDTGLWSRINDLAWIDEFDVATEGTMNPNVAMDLSVPWNSSTYASNRMSKFMVKAQGAYWYVSDELGGNRLYQSNIDDPEVINLAAYVEFNNKIVGVSVFNDKPIVWTEDDLINRVEGFVGNDGSGFISSVAVDGVYDLKSNSSIVETPRGLVFLSNDSICFTDGVTAMKISEQIKETYFNLFRFLGREYYDSIRFQYMVDYCVGTYNPTLQYVIYSVVDRPTQTKTTVIIDLRGKVTKEVPIFTWTIAGSVYYPEAYFYSKFADKLLVSNEGEDRFLNSELYEDQAIAGSTTIPYRLELGNLYFGTDISRKILKKTFWRFDKCADPTVGTFLTPFTNSDERAETPLQEINQYNINTETSGDFFGDATKYNNTTILNCSRRVPAKNTRAMYYNIGFNSDTPTDMSGNASESSYMKLLSVSVVYAVVGDTANATFTDLGSGGNT